MHVVANGVDAPGASQFTVTVSPGAPVTSTDACTKQGSQNDMCYDTHVHARTESLSKERELKRFAETETHLSGSPSRAQPLPSTGATVCTVKSYIPHAWSSIGADALKDATCRQSCDLMMSVNGELISPHRVGGVGLKHNIGHRVVEPKLCGQTMSAQSEYTLDQARLTREGVMVYGDASSAAKR